MKCQNCGINDANVNLAMNINNQKMQMHLCNACFQEMKSKTMNPNSFFGGNGFGGNGFGGQEFNNFNQSNGGYKAGAQTQTKAPQKDGPLDQIGTNLTDKARQSGIDPVIAHDHAVTR